MPHQHPIHTCGRHSSHHSLWLSQDTAPSPWPDTSQCRSSWLAHLTKPLRQPCQGLQNAKATARHTHSLLQDSHEAKREDRDPVWTRRGLHTGRAHTDPLGNPHTQNPQTLPFRNRVTHTHSTPQRWPQPQRHTQTHRGAHLRSHTGPLWEGRSREHATQERHFVHTRGQWDKQHILWGDSLLDMPHEASWPRPRGPQACCLLTRLGPCWIPEDRRHFPRTAPVCSQQLFGERNDLQ